MDNKEIEHKFVSFFIKKEKRARNLHELNNSKKRQMFIDRFHHAWQNIKI